MARSRRRALPATGPHGGTCCDAERTGACDVDTAADTGDTAR